MKVWRAVLVLAVLACTMEMAARAGAQSDMGPCLIGCGQQVIMCAGQCRSSGSGIGSLTCYRACGVRNVGCITSCIGTPSLPKLNRP
ncbi:hypothetical protein ACS0TY_026866 [Phlomoides rotata]